MKVRAIKYFKDAKVNKDRNIGDIFEVDEERLQVLLNHNAVEKIVDEIVNSKEVEEIIDNVVEEVVEKIVEKPKKSNKKKK